MKVNVLGTEYTIVFDVPDKDMPEDSDGCMDQSVKTIKIALNDPPKIVYRSTNPLKKLRRCKQ